MQVEPGPYDLRLTELFQWNDGSFLSTLHGKTHRFRVHLPNDPPDTYTEAQALDELFGVAGQPGAFYMQLRDEYGNLVQNRLDDGSELTVEIIGQRNGELIYLGTEASPNIPERNYMGFGIYAVRFFSSEAAAYTVRIEVDGVEVKKVVQVRAQPNEVPTLLFHCLVNYAARISNQFANYPIMSFNFLDSQNANIQVMQDL
jgi:hypothetical protein